MANSGASSGEVPEMNQLNQALEFHRCGNLTSAKEIYERVLISHPENAEVLHLLGVIALQTKDLEKAIGLISKALVINPQMPNAFSNLGNVYKEQKELDKALKCYQCALKIDPLFADALSNIGNIYYVQGKYAEALNFYNRTIEINAYHADAYYNRGNLFLYFSKNSAAASDYSKALAIDPSIVDAYLNRGQAHKKMGNYPAALSDFSHVIEIQPRYAEAYYHRAVTYFAADDHTWVALEDLKKAAQLKPDLDYLLSAIFFNKKTCADWSDLETSGDQLLEMSTLGKRAITPFAFISHFDSLPQQLNVTKTWITSQINQDGSGLSLLQKIPRKEKIHLGYFSSDFNEHPVTYASAGLFRHHDKNKFKITGFYFGRKRDATVESLSKVFDEFYSIADLSDVAVTELARKLKIDIAIDMNGCTSGSRPAIFLNQAALVQVNYLGYPGTMGTLLMDYIIADEVVIPPESQKYYTEKTTYLDCFMPHDNQLKVSDKKFTRSELDLPQAGFVFCGFNNSYKITSQVWGQWMDILKAVPQSVLWLSYRNDPTSNNLRKEAQARGVDPARIVFARRMDEVGEHMARLKCADLFLDTYPYNAHTTATAALWAGLPVLTRMGESFASRVGASLLSTCQLPELIVRTPEEYQALAIDLANKPQKIADFKKRLSSYRENNPLFNSEKYTRKLENLFCQMYERSQSGLLPQNLKLPNEPRD